MRPLARVALLAALVAVLPGCRVLGLWTPECTPGDDATCLSGQVCGADGICLLGGAVEPGEDAGPPPPGEDGGPPPDNSELVVDGQVGVYLLARTPAGVLFWATGGDAGCVRRMAPGGAVEDVHCGGPGTSVEGLALTDNDVVWIENGNEDRLMVKAQSAIATAPAAALSVAVEDVGTVLEYGPALVAARTVDGEQVYAWTQEPTDSFGGVERVLRGVSGLVTAQTRYGVLFANGRLGGVALTPDDVYFTLTSDLYARVLIRDNHARDETGGYSAYSDDGDNTDYPPGAGYAVATFNDAVYVATRGNADEGGILTSRGAFPDGFLGVDLVTAQVDPDSASRYARGLATDGDALYYTTGGLGESPPGVFRLSLALDAVPERLLTLATEGGSVVLDDDSVYWSDPEAGAIRRLPR